MFILIGGESQVPALVSKETVMLKRDDKVNYW